MNMNLNRLSRPADWPRAVLFDLDGTLVDPVPVLTRSANRLLEEERLEPLALNDIRNMAGCGSRALVREAFAARNIALAEPLLSRKADLFFRYYVELMTTHSVLREGAIEALSAFAEQGIRIAVVTNKPASMARRIVKHFGLSEYIGAINGGGSGTALKPAPDMLLQALSDFGVSGKDSLMVGDSPVDVAAAKAVPMVSIAICGKYSVHARHRLDADLIIDSLTSLPKAIEQLKGTV
ncbi:HAD family hydrolase [Hoeflea sp. TYP-13]|uniref:HAD family hydrolase n=1 Tax=Hoeflea sp. TYP-13 TaxID=3230023 RepID=UPI0034C658B3